MGGDRAQRRQFVLNASDGLAVDAVIDLVRAAGQSERETVSHSMLRMLSKLAQHTRGASSKRRALADQSVREQVAELVKGWSLDDPNPDAYRSALQRIASSAPQASQQREQHAAEPERILQMALELGAAGPAVDDAIKRLVERGEISKLAAALTAAETSDAAAGIWKQVANPDVVQRLVSTDPLDVEQLDVVLPRVGAAAAPALLDALVASDSSQTRRALLDRLTRMGAVVGPLAVVRLRDASWFVQRNMLALLRSLPALPPGFDARHFVEHPDARVRREALRLLFADPALRDQSICRALTDTDERTVRLALNAAQEGCPEAAVPLVTSLATRGASADQRVEAIKVLGAASSPAAVDALSQLVAPKHRLSWLGRPSRTPEYRAAVTALKAHADKSQVAALLKKLGEA
jgi:hypothetical protein